MGGRPFASPCRPRTRSGRHEAKRPLGTSFGTSCGLIWGPLAASLQTSFLFTLLSSLFSLLSSPCRRGFATPRSHEAGHPRLMTYPVSSVAVVQNSNVWPSLLSSLCSLLSLLSSLFSRCRSFLRSHFAPAPSIFASGHRRRPQLLRPFAAPSLARRNARSD